jgi:CheY-like chemotaxis protein
MTEDCNLCNKILIIDDNCFNILALQLLLSTFIDHKSDEAINGAAGLELMEQKLKSCCKKPYMLVFVDLNMPVMDGVKMLEYVKGNNMAFAHANKNFIKAYSKTSFVLNTAGTDGRVNYQNKGFEYFLEKPIE